VVVSPNDVDVRDVGVVGTLAEVTIVSGIVVETDDEGVVRVGTVEVVSKGVDVTTVSLIVTLDATGVEKISHSAPV
jgi:hypothetical protein